MDFKNNGFQKERIERLKWIKDYLEQIVTNEGSISYKDVFFTVSYRYGLKPDTVNEHLDFIIEGCGFELVESKIVKKLEKPI